MDKIVVLDTGYESYAYEETLFKSHGYRFELYEGKPDDAAGKLQFARDAVGILVRWTEIDANFLKRTARLKAIVRYGAGYENIDIDAATRAGILVSNVRGYGNHAVSDHALTLMYACARGLPAGTKYIKTEFGKPPFKNIIEFHQCTLGIIGLGRIGGTLCKKSAHLFDKVIAHDPYVNISRFDALGATCVSLEDLLNQSNVISIHCNLTGETTGLINKTAFDMMSMIPILINTARGPVVDTTELLKALDNGKLHSAGIDVFDTEIPEKIPEPLLSHKKIVSTGHYAWYSENAINELQKRAAQNMINLLDGKQIEDCLTDK